MRIIRAKFRIRPELRATDPILFRRHAPNCAFKALGRAHFLCDCPLWCDLYVGGIRKRETLKTRDWPRANKVLQAWMEDPSQIGNDLARFDLDGVTAGIAKIDTATRVTIGAIAELIVSTDLLNRGFHVFRALSPNCCCDLIAIHSQKMLRVEVKSASLTASGNVIAPQIKNSGCFDVLAIVTRQRGIIYEPKHLIIEELASFRVSYAPVGRIRCQNAAAALAIAAQVSLESKCRSKRGVVIWKDGIIVATGFNYLPVGACDQSDECKATCAKRAVHAEQSALLACGVNDRAGAEMLHVKTVDGLAVVSGPPSCLECSKLIHVSGVASIWLLHENGLCRYSADEFHWQTLAHNKAFT